MENYSYQSYPDSGESSPRSREIDFENPPPWDDQQQQQQPQNYKVKFMCSYGGKINPRSHDNQLSYVGGETKILAVDRATKFPAMLAKLSALCDAATPQDNNNNLTFKYQLPGEDLDALISVTNEDDLDHMMHEYDRLYRASARPARMRLFLFVTEAGPASPPLDPVKPNNADFLFGLDKGVAVAAPPPAAVKFHDPVPQPVAPPPEYQSRLNLNPVDRVAGSDPSALQRQLQQLQIAENEQGAYRRKSEESYPAGDYYVQKMPEKFPPPNLPAGAGYWSEKHVSGEAYHPAVSAPSGGGEQPVYMIQTPGTFYHAPVVRPPATQGYYTVQRVASDGYREAPVYGGVPPPKPPFSSAVPASLAQPVKGPTYTEGFGVVRPSAIQDSTGAPYAQVAYDSASGRQVYYTAPGGVVHAPPYQGGFPPLTADRRPGGVSLGQDLKVISKVTQGSV